MKQFVCWYRGFDIYRWSTGKYEAYWENGGTHHAGRSVEAVQESIDKILSTE